MNKPVFNPKALKAITSPDDLEKTVRVTTPGIWLILLACAALLAGLIAWGFWGTATTGVKTRGVVLENHQVISLLTEAEMRQIKVGETADVNGVTATVETISTLPISRSEAVQMLGSAYLAEDIMNKDWGFPVTLKLDSTDSFTRNLSYPVHIMTERVSPISLLFR